jgi:hypothetical protein
MTETRKQDAVMLVALGFHALFAREAILDYAPRT